jgi:hypothetical protein
MLARLLFKTCLSPNQKKIFRKRKNKKRPSGRFLLGINIDMISQIKYSGLFPEKHISPVGTVLGLNQPQPQPAVVPVVPQPVKS